LPVTYYESLSKRFLTFCCQRKTAKF
jgi:hypothetical protein